MTGTAPTLPTDDSGPFLFLESPIGEVCLPVTAVERVVALPALHPVPGAPAWFQGILDLGGEAVPVMDLALALGWGETDDYTLETPLVVVQQGERRVGVVVPRVLGVARRPPASGETAHQTLFGPTSPPFVGVIRGLAEPLALILDPARLVAPELTGQPTLLPPDPALLATWRRLREERLARLPPTAP